MKKKSTEYKPADQRILFVLSYFYLFFFYFHLFLDLWLPLVETFAKSQIFHFFEAQCGVMLNNKYSRGCIDQIWQPEAPVKTN